MPTYTFLLGNTPKLSFAEIAAISPSVPQLVKEDLAEVELPDDQTAMNLLKHLGGSIEVSRKEDTQTIPLLRHDFKHWIVKDRAKPFVDHKRGMLPPKVARILVNLGLGQLKNQEITLYDPFCGTGTILMEALENNIKVIGSDIEQEAVTGTEKNLNWLAKNNPGKNEWQVFKQDATQVKATDLKWPVNLIVTEPFLGKPRPKMTQLPNIFKGLYKLYLGSFKNWTKILVSGAILVVILPKAETPTQVFDLKNLIDKLPQLGYTTLLAPLSYARKDAIIKRQILVLKYVTR